eukprot:CAMPEP_0173317910 /NCGR_PEP_ID=MMETSP1143-20121109/27367_1 /TAXON_ID=483371 /ORGANISM="non described non described, Strain CCMP2298" /LENGTH=51 /DNA_ID=CAMNT_0014261103 /DNA_START=115 /DNA_END=267 /DNA_ORIENTATION=+
MRLTIEVQRAVLECAQCSTAAMQAVCAAQRGLSSSLLGSTHSTKSSSTCGD